jgi:hypothetical protein
MHRRACLLLPLLLLATVAAPRAAPRWEFHLDWPEEAAIATLSACTPEAGPAVTLHSERGAGYVRALRGTPAAPRGDRLALAPRRAGECVELAIDLLAAGRDDRYGLGYRAGEYLRLPPGRWLWRPPAIDPDSRLQLTLPPGWQASLPWPRAADGRYRLGGTPADWPAVGAFGRFAEERLKLPGGSLRIAVLPTGAAVSGVGDWLAAVAGDLATAYARAPLPDVQVLVVPLPGEQAAVPWGQVTRGGGSAVHLFIGAAAGRAGWRADWTATHEFAHLLHPFLGDRGRWLAEGLASYYQNVLRARSGALSGQQALDQLRAGFERGRAATPPGAVTLEQAALGRRRGSTMRVYWAGAAFWLESDLLLRRHGDSLDRALAAFAAIHLPSEQRWTPERFMAALASLAPDGDWLARHAAYAAARRFPDGARLLGDSASAGQVQAILAPRYAVSAQPRVGDTDDGPGHDAR